MSVTGRKKTGCVDRFVWKGAERAQEPVAGPVNLLLDRRLPPGLDLDLVVLLPGPCQIRVVSTVS